VPVRIGDISAALQRLGASSFEFKQVTLLDAQQRPALQLPRVLASISPQSLLAFELRFEQLLIEGAQLEVRATRPAGSSSPGSTSAPPPTRRQERRHRLRDWFFRQHEFIIRGGSAVLDRRAARRAARWR
jgi:hypothetical protein